MEMTGSEREANKYFITEHERAEDLLKNIFDIENDNGIAVQAELKKRMPMTQWELKRLIRYLEGQALINLTEDDAGELVVELTGKGRNYAAEIFRKHDQLKEFLRTVCNVTDDVADNNAHRIEHVISNEIIAGIREFMRDGHPGSRVVSHRDLSILYEPGEYVFDIAIYENGSQHPRTLSDDGNLIESDTKITVGLESYFEVKLRDGVRLDSIWYYNGMIWKKAERKADVFRISSDAFTYDISGWSGMISGTGLIALLNRSGMPNDEDIKIVNVHLW